MAWMTFRRIRSASFNVCGWTRKGLSFLAMVLPLPGALPGSMRNGERRRSETEEVPHTQVLTPSFNPTRRGSIGGNLSRDQTGPRASLRSDDLPRGTIVHPHGDVCGHHARPLQDSETLLHRTTCSFRLSRLFPHSSSVCFCSVCEYFLTPRPALAGCGATPQLTRLARCGASISRNRHENAKSSCMGHGP